MEKNYKEMLIKTLFLFMLWYRKCKITSFFMQHGYIRTNGIKKMLIQNYLGRVEVPNKIIQMSYDDEVPFKLKLICL